MRLARAPHIDADPEIERICGHQPIGKNRAMVASVAGSNVASSSPFSTTRSVEITPSAPLVVATPTRARAASAASPARAAH